MKDYHPFGLTFNHYSSSNLTTSQNYKYNGKEEQQEWGVLDFDTRMHDPALGRFMGIDLLAADYSFQSPYVYAANNPIRFIDLEGMNPEDPKNKGSRTISMTENDASSQNGSSNTITERINTTDVGRTKNDNGDWIYNITTTKEVNTVELDEEGDVSSQSSVKTTTSETFAVVDNGYGIDIKGKKISTSVNTTESDKANISSEMQDLIDVQTDYNQYHLGGSLNTAWSKSLFAQSMDQNGDLMVGIGIGATMQRAKEKKHTVYFRSRTNPSKSYRKRSRGGMTETVLQNSIPQNLHGMLKQPLFKN